MMCAAELSGYPQLRHGVGTWLHRLPRNRKNVTTVCQREHVTRQVSKPSPLKPRHPVSSLKPFIAYSTSSDISNDHDVSSLLHQVVVYSLRPLVELVRKPL